MPEYYGSWQTVYSRFRKWEKEGIFEKILNELNKDADIVHSFPFFKQALITKGLLMILILCISI